MDFFTATAAVAVWAWDWCQGLEPTFPSGIGSFVWMFAFIGMIVVDIYLIKSRDILDSEMNFFFFFFINIITALVLGFVGAGLYIVLITLLTILVVLGYLIFLDKNAFVVTLIGLAFVLGKLIVWYVGRDIARKKQTEIDERCWQLDLERRKKIKAKRKKPVKRKIKRKK